MGDRGVSSSSCEPLEGRTFLAVDVGGPDLTYGDNGKVVFPRPYFDNYFSGGTLTPDGKIFGIANWQRGGGNMARWGLDGSFDPSFGQRGKLTYSYRYRGYNIDTAVAPDGKVVRAYHDYTPSGPGQDHVERYLANGKPDRTFGIDGRRLIYLPPAAVITTVLLLPDGKVIVGARHGGGKPTFILQRFTPDGILDKSFGAGGTAKIVIPEAIANTTVELNELLLTDDGKIVIVGSDEGFNYANEKMTMLARVYVGRVMPGGKPDRSFGDGGVAGATIRTDGAFGGYGLGGQLQGDGVVVSASDGEAPVMFRFSAAGALNETFGNGGRATPLGADADDLYSGNVAFAVQGNGGIVVAGRRWTSEADFFGDRTADVLLMRLTPDGRLDRRFGDEGFTQTHLGTEAVPGDVAIQDDGGILVMGSTDANSPPGWGRSLFAARYYGSNKTKPADMPIERPTYTRTQLKKLVDDIATNDPTMGYFDYGERILVRSKAIDAVVNTGVAALPFLLARMKREDVPFDTFARCYTAADQIISSVDASLGPIAFPGADIAPGRLLPRLPDVPANRKVTIADLTRKIRALRDSLPQ